jgi:hypothetical protein
VYAAREDPDFARSDLAIGEIQYLGDCMGDFEVRVALFGRTVVKIANAG